MLLRKFFGDKASELVKHRKASDDTRVSVTDHQIHSTRAQWRLGLLATVDFSGHGISPSPMRVRVTNSGLLGESSLRSGKSAAARQRRM